MASIKETAESIKLRAEAVKLITAKRVQLEKNSITKNFDRIVKWQELKKQFVTQAKYGDDPKEKAEYQQMAKDSGTLEELAKSIRDSADEQLKLIKELDLTDDNKKLESALKKIETKGKEVDNYQKAYANEKKQSGNEIKQKVKEKQDRLKGGVMDSIKDAFNPDNQNASEAGQLIGAICGLVRSYVEKKETDLPK